MNGTRLDQFRRRAGFGVVAGIAMIFVSGRLMRLGPESLLFSGAVCLVGWALLLWGCENYMRWKGYSGWFGLFGYLLLPGLIILVCFPNRRNRILQMQQSGVVAKIGEISKEDEKSGWQFLPGLLPLGVLFLVFAGFLLRARSSIDAGEWKQVAPPGIGFQVLMPGTPRWQQQTNETPAGQVELDKVIVMPKGKHETFMIVVIRFPEDFGPRLGGPKKLLELGRKDVLSGSQGKVRSEKQIALNGYPGLELEVLPPNGAVIKAQIYLIRNQLYELSAYVSEIRLASEDVKKFFDSFKLLNDQAAAE